MSVMTASKASDAQARGKALGDHDGPWTVDELLDHDQHKERSRIELVGGALIVSPSPSWSHQKASYRLMGQLESAIIASDAPFDVVEAFNVRTADELFIPDLVVADYGAVKDGAIAVSMEDVLLLVEIVSPGNARMDRQLKPAAYAELGLEHYWRLEPAAATPELIVNTLAGGEYKETVRVTGTARVPVGDHFVVDVDVPALFRRRR